MIGGHSPHLLLHSQPSFSLQFHPNLTSQKVPCSAKFIEVVASPVRTDISRKLERPRHGSVRTESGAWLQCLAVIQASLQLWDKGDRGRTGNKATTGAATIALNTNQFVGASDQTPHVLSWASLHVLHRRREFLQRHAIVPQCRHQKNKKTRFHRKNLKVFKIGFSSHENNLW